MRVELVRMRFAAKAEIELEEHSSTLVFGEQPPGALPNADYGREAWEVLDADVGGEPIAPEELERLRIEAGTPRFGAEIDDRVLPAEAGLTERAVSFSKGCYPGQEPIARQHYRGKLNRRLRVLDLEGERRPRRGDPARREGRRPRDERRARPRARVRAHRGAGRRRPRDRRRKGAATLGHFRARSSGDRALPCGGRGRKFESCRAHAKNA